MSSSTESEEVKQDAIQIYERRRVSISQRARGLAPSSYRRTRALKNAPSPDVSYDVSPELSFGGYETFDSEDDLTDFSDEDPDLVERCCGGGEDALATMEQQCANANERNTSLKADCDRKRERCEELEKEVEDLQRQNRKLDREKQELEKRIAEMALPDDEQLQILRDQLSEKETAIQELSDKIVVLGQELASLNEQESEQCNVNASALAQKEVELKEVKDSLLVLQKENTTLKEKSTWSTEEMERVFESDNDRFADVLIRKVSGNAPLIATVLTDLLPQKVWEEKELLDMVQRNTAQFANVLDKLTFRPGYEDKFKEVMEKMGDLWIEP
eukprot:974929_1